MHMPPLRETANGLPFFKSVDDREKLLGVIGALVLRRISLGKASEIMGMGREAFLGLDVLLGVILLPHNSSSAISLRT
jgi:predicted tellurium resistance membrane protein TerC